MTNKIKQWFRQPTDQEILDRYESGKLTSNALVCMGIIGIIVTIALILTIL